MEKLKLVRVLETFPKGAQVPSRLVAPWTFQVTFVNRTQPRVCRAGKTVTASDGGGTLKTVHCNRTTEYAGIVTGLFVHGD